MSHRAFLSFIWPSALAMILFIALPIVSVAVQSLFVAHEQVFVEVENCGPFGCKVSQKIDVEATKALRADQPLGQFNGLGTYLNRNHLASAEIATAWRTRTDMSGFVAQIFNLPFYKALSFTLTYTFLVTPFVIILGFFVAL